VVKSVYIVVYFLSFYDSKLGEEMKISELWGYLVWCRWDCYIRVSCFRSPLPPVHVPRTRWIPTSFCCKLPVSSCL